MKIIEKIKWMGNNQWGTTNKAGQWLDVIGTENKIDMLRQKINEIIATVNLEEER